MTDTILNGLIALVTLILCVRIFWKDGEWNVPYARLAFRFFTVQSNVLCALAAGLMCLFPHSLRVWLLKYIGTAAVTVTMLTVFLFLAPSIGKGGLRQLLRGGDLFMHLLTPLLALVSFCVFERRGLTLAQTAMGLLPVLVYGVWYLYKIRFAPSDRRWEDFYGFNKGGRWPVSMAAMLLGTTAVCLLLRTAQNL